jgi:hypothetical protein
MPKDEWRAKESQRAKARPEQCAPCAPETKVASFLKQGQRLENLSWRLWHLKNLMVNVDSAKSKREFKRLSKKSLSKTSSTKRPVRAHSAHSQRSIT